MHIHHSPFVSREDRADVVNHEDVFDMKDSKLELNMRLDELDDSLDEHKAANNDEYMQVPAFFDDHQHFYNGRARNTINHAAFRTQ